MHLTKVSKYTKQKLIELKDKSTLLEQRLQYPFASNRSRKQKNGKDIDDLSTISQLNLMDIHRTLL